jgi:thiol-disulfide isomerase/thioredoxin
MKYKHWIKMNKLKITFLTFLMALLISYDSFASILNLNTEPSSHIENGFFTREKNEKQVTNSFSESRLSKDYEFIFFYSLSCTYCKSFAPVLKKYSDNSGINVRGFIIGGNSSNLDNHFPDFFDSTVVKQEVLERFFGKGSGIAVPVLFILNKENLHAYPVSQGSLTYLELARKMDELITKILNNEAKMTGKNHEY